MIVVNLHWNNVGNASILHCKSVILSSLDINYNTDILSRKLDNCIEKHYEKINLLYFSKVQDRSARLQPAQLS